MAKKTADETSSLGRTHYNITPEQFVKVWQVSETSQEVADKLGMPLPIIFARASSYRKAGVHPKKLKRKEKQGAGRGKVWNRLIDQLAAGRSPEELNAEAESRGRRRRG